MKTKMIIYSFLAIFFLFMSIVCGFNIPESDTLSEFIFFCLFFTEMLMIVFLLIFSYLAYYSIKDLLYDNKYNKMIDVFMKKTDFIDLESSLIDKRYSIDSDLLQSIHNPDENPIYTGYNGLY